MIFDCSAGGRAGRPLTGRLLVRLPACWSVSEQDTEPKNCECDKCFKAVWAVSKRVQRCRSISSFTLTELMYLSGSMDCYTLIIKHFFHWTSWQNEALLFIFWVITTNFSSINSAAVLSTVTFIFAAVISAVDISELITTNQPNDSHALFVGFKISVRFTSALCWTCLTPTAEHSLEQTPVRICEWSTNGSQNKTLRTAAT